MSEAKIPAERLAGDQIVVVQGKTSYSRLARPVTGKELEASIARSKAAGRLYPTTRPHTTISIIDAQVLYADPTNPTLEEQFVAQRLFTYQKGENAGRIGYSIDDTSPFLPLILVPDEENPGKHRQQILENDLAADLSVRIVLHTFRSKSGYQKTGIGIQQVVLDEPLKYYSGGSNTAELAARGITISGGITRVSADDTATNTPAAQQGAYVGTDENGFPTAGPAPTQGSAPAPQPQVQQAPQQAPVQQQAPQQTTPAVQQQAPVQQQDPQQTVAPVTQQAAPVEETQEQKIARLQAQLEAARNSGGAEGTSAFDQNQPTHHNPSPWD